MNTSSSQPFSSRIVTVSSSCSTNASTVNHNNFQTHINGSISTGSNSSTDLNHDQIFAPNAWWRSFGNSYTNANTNLQQQEEIQQYANLISLPTSGNVIQDSDSCSIIDWDNFFAPSCNSHQEPKILTSIPSQQQQASSTCKITINPNCTNSFDNSSDSATANFICHNNYSTTTTSATVTNNNTSNIDGMISLLNRILIMNGVNPAASNQCQIPTISSSAYQHSNMETNPTTFVTETANFNYAPIQSFDQMQTQPACNLLNYTSIPSQSTHNTSFSSSSSSDSDSTGSQHSNNSIGNKNKIAKKRTTRPRLKFQKEADKSIKFNLITSEELAATLQFHETLMPTSGGKRTRGRPKKSESSPQKPKAEQSTNIEFMVNCYDQCSKIFK